MDVQKFGSAVANVKMDRPPTPAEQRQAKIAEKKLTQAEYKTSAGGGAHMELMDKIRSTKAGNRSKMVMDFSKNSPRGGVTQMGVDSQV